MIKVGSDFSGVGAFNQALIRLGIEHEEVFACDMDKFARQTFIHNYGEPKYYPKNVYDREIPEDSLDVYMTSPPCQAFSLAGKRKGKDDERGILFFNSHEFIVKNKPRYFIFENVKGLLSDDNGRTFQEWINYLGGKSVNGVPIIFPHEESVPYHIYWKVLNAKNHGVPQNRERVFIVGIRDDQDNVFSWPKEEPLEKRLKDILEPEVDQKYFLSERMITGLLNKPNKNFKFEPHDKYTPYSKCLTARYFKQAATDPYIKTLSTNKGEGVKILRRERTPEQKEERRKTGSNSFSGKITKFVDSEHSPCVTTLSMDKEKTIFDGYTIRRLTPRECFRLMDFPDSFTWPVSDSQAYKQAGNSIVVKMLELIISKFRL